MVSVIDRCGLRDAAIELIFDSKSNYTPKEAAAILSNMCDAPITPTDYISFRAEYNSAVNHQNDIVPLDVPKPLSKLPDELVHMCSFSTFDTLGLRNGLAAKAVELVNSCMDENEPDRKSALMAIRTANEICESIDKKVRALNATDPTTLMLNSEALSNLHECLLDIDREYPEFQLLFKLQIAAQRRRKQQIIDVTSE